MPIFLLISLWHHIAHVEEFFHLLCFFSSNSKVMPKVRSKLCILPAVFSPLFIFNTFLMLMFIFILYSVDIVFSGFLPSLPGNLKTLISCSIFLWHVSPPSVVTILLL